MSRWCMALLVLAMLLVMRIGDADEAQADKAEADEAQADEPHGDDAIEQRLHFIEERLKLEANSARVWEGGWSVVDVGGAAYAAYQISQQSNRAELAEGIIGLAKSTSGVIVLAVLPLRATRAPGELEAHSHDTDRVATLRLAEHLLQRNADSVDERFTWRPHTVSLLVNLAGAIVIGALGDWGKGFESAGIGVATAQLQIWTRPWRARRDLREYKQRFGAELDVGASGVGVRF